MNWRAGHPFAAVAGAIVLVTVWSALAEGLPALGPFPDGYAYSRAGSVIIVPAPGAAEVVLGPGRDPSLSPDGKWVACVRDDPNSAGSRLVGIELATRVETVLVRSSSAIANSAWSTTIDELAFTWTNPTSGRHELAIWERIIPHSTRTVLTSDAMLYAPSWYFGNITVHDREHLLVVDFIGTIYRKIPLASITGAPGKVNRADRFVFSPYNPDLVAFTMQVDPTPGLARGRDGLPTALFVHDLQTRQTKRLTPAGMSAVDLAWSYPGTLWFTGVSDTAASQPVPMWITRANLDGTGQVVPRQEAVPRPEAEPGRRVSPASVQAAEPPLSLPALLMMVVAAVLLVVNFSFRRAERYPTALFLTAILVLLGFGSLLFRRMLTLPAAVSHGPDFTFGWLSCLLALVSTVRSYIRYGPRVCTACGTRLRLLSETEDDEKLEYGQALEERLGAVNYEVWVCPTCARANLESYANFLRGRRRCPKCGYHTLGRRNHDSSELCENCKRQPPPLMIPPPPPSSVPLPPPPPAAPARLG